MALGPPFTDVRIERPQTLGKLDGLPGLMKIDLYPPASGPEIELTFGTMEGAQPVGEDLIGLKVEEATRLPVLAMRQREGK